MILLAIVVFVALVVAFYWACAIFWNLLLEKVLKILEEKPLKFKQK